MCLDNVLPMYLQRMPEPVSVSNVSRGSFNVTANSPGLDMYLHVPVGAFDLDAETELKLIVYAPNLTSLSGVPQFIGVIQERFSSLYRVNMDGYAAIHIAAHVDDMSDVLNVVKPVYLYLSVPAGDPTLVSRLSTWFYNETLGIWQLVSTRAFEYLDQEQTLVIEISKLGWWALASNWTDTSCVTVRVLFSSPSRGTLIPLAGSVVSVAGDDYSYSAIRGTDAAGWACLELKSLSSSSLRVVDKRLAIDSGYIPMRSSNSSACRGIPRWLNGVPTKTICTKLEVICKQSCFLNFKHCIWIYLFFCRISC